MGERPFLEPELNRQSARPAASMSGDLGDIFNDLLLYHTSTRCTYLLLNHTCTYWDDVCDCPAEAPDAQSVESALVAIGRSIESC